MLDANGTKHYLVFAQQDWMTLADQATPIGPDSPPSPADGPVPNTRYDVGRVELTLTPKIAVGDETSVPLSARRGAAADAIGNVYFIDPTETAILTQSAADGSVTTYWPAPQLAVEPLAGAFSDAPETATPLAPASLSALTVTTENYLIVGATAPNGLLVFDLQGTTSPTLIPWTASTSWSPIQLSATADGGVVILDRSTQPAYWRLDRAFDVEPAGRALAPRSPEPGSFSPAGGGAGGGAVSPPTSQNAVALAGDPIAIAALRDWVLVLDAGAGGPSLLRVYRHGAEVGDPIPLGDDAAGTPIVGHDMIAGPPLADEAAAGHLYVASATRAQAFDFLLIEQRGSLSAQLTSRYMPLRSYGGRGLANGPRYDFGSYWVPLAAQPPASYASAAAIVTRPFDGVDPGCTWHRLMIDAVVPPGCSLSISSRAADDDVSLAGLQFSPEPTPVPRPDGSEQPYVELPDGWSTYETLFQQARGRYLQLQLGISGNGRNSPRLRALRVYYPRFSYLEQYLPGLYRADPDSASFLDRYLANVEGINTTIEDLIASAQALLDPRAAPAEALEWLASFFDLALDPAWSEDRSRLLIEHAMDFFRRRGTVLGLQMALRLALDSVVDESVFSDPPAPRTLMYRIVELFQSPLPGASSLIGPGAGSGPRSVSPTTPWIPAYGLDALLALYQEFLAQQSPGTATPTEFPLTQPPAVTSASAWEAFLAQVLGFQPPDATAQDSWAQFLSQRYSSLADLNVAYAPGIQPPQYSTFEVPVPTTVPADGPAQVDWYQFAALVLPAIGNSHRFIVLLPKPPGAASDPSQVDPLGQLPLAKRLIDLYKPAHTTYELRFYWAAFQVGDARLEHDTAIDVGSRAPQLRVPAQLGNSYAASSYLGGQLAPLLAPQPSIGRDVTLPQ